MTKTEFQAALRNRIEQSVAGLAAALGRDDLRQRMMAIHSWAEGSARPADRPDVLGLALYGIAALAAAGTFAVADLCLDAELPHKQAYWRQAVDHVVNRIETPWKPAFFGKVLSDLGLPAEFNPQATGSEIVAIWTAELGTSFLPLSVLVESGAESFLHWPDQSDPLELRDDFGSELAGVSAMLHCYRGSPVHGDRIKRILRCYRGMAERSRMAGLADALAGMGIAAEPDPDPEVRQLEIELGLRSAVPSQRTTGSRRRRR